MDHQTAEPQSASEILMGIAEKAALGSDTNDTLPLMPEESAPAPDPGTGIAITRHLSVPLTEARKLALLDELAGHVNVYKQLEKLKTDSSASYSKSMRQHRAESETIGETIAQGIEMKLIPCKKYIDYVKGRVLVIRLDTNAVLEDKALEEEDMKP